MPEPDPTYPEGDGAQGGATETIEVAVSCPPPLRDALTGALLDLGFEAFEETEEELRAYMNAGVWSGAVLESIAEWLHHRGVEGKTVMSRIPAQNWNARWEAGIKPIRVGRFCIKPTWCACPEDVNEVDVLEIDPKMTFGTGYHESTRLMLWLMEAWLRPGCRVLDAGTGTGILAIAAVRLGAEHVFAFDIDPWVDMNARENLVRNAVAPRVELRIGDFEVVPEEPFDAVLANIQLNALRSLAPSFATRLQPGKHLFVSGILRPDRSAMIASANRAGFGLVDEAEEGDWWAGVFERTPGADG